LLHNLLHILHHTLALQFNLKRARFGLMRIIRRGSHLHLRKRVPRRYRSVEEREFIWQSLHTDSETVAKAKAPQVWQDMIGAWEAKLDGSTDVAEERIAAAKKLAARRRVRYLPAAEVARLLLPEIMNRIEATLTRKGKIDLMEADAMLGCAPLPEITVTKALNKFWTLAKDRTLGKSPDQIRRWENPRKKAVANFVDLVGDMNIKDITTRDLMDFREWWVDRIAAGKVTAASANKDFIHLTSMLKDVLRANDWRAKFSTEGLQIQSGKKVQRPAFSLEWIKDRLLAPGALDGLNAEARCIMLGMVNTGYRPSEGAMLTKSQIRLDASIPHIKIEGVGRTLKSNYSERVIPLSGVSLEAFRQFPEGFPRYADSPTLSDTINKFLRENRLLETVDHSLYGIRHSFEDRMLAAGFDERIRRDLMGHRLDRERYGKGASLQHLHQLVSGIAL
jgi:integrase